MNVSRETWNILKQKGIRATAQLPSIPTIKKLKHPNNVANAFNTFFLTITGKLNTYEVLKVDAFSFYKISGN